MAKTETVRINTATLEELKSLKFIGASRAQKIIDYRNAGGYLYHHEELARVVGISKEQAEELVLNIDWTPPLTSSRVKWNFQTNNFSSVDIYKDIRSQCNKRPHCCFHVNT